MSTSLSRGGTPPLFSRCGIHTSDKRAFKRLWVECGGEIKPVVGTGEVRYLHASFTRSVRANDRRHDVPAVLLSRINQILKLTLR